MLFEYAYIIRNFQLSIFVFNAFDTLADRLILGGIKQIQFGYSVPIYSFVSSKIYSMNISPTVSIKLNDPNTGYCKIRGRGKQAINIVNRKNFIS